MTIRRQGRGENSRLPPCRLVGFFLLVVAMVFWRLSIQLPTITPSASDSSLKRKHSSSQKTQRSNSPIHFVIFLGLEGVGHHFWQDLILDSPMVSRLQDLGSAFYPKMTTRLMGSLYKHKASIHHKGLWSAPCTFNYTFPAANVTEIETDLVNLLESMKWFVQQKAPPQNTTTNQGSTKHDPVLVPVNLLKNGQVMSYPTFAQPCRPLQYSNIALWYDICNQAEVACDHVYLYRNPWSVLKSTTINRNFNKGNMLGAIHLYTTQLQILHSQLLMHPDRVVGCWDYDSALSPEQWKQEVEPLLHFQTSAAYGAALQKVYRKPNILTDQDRDAIVPPEFQPYMKTMIELHNVVVETCQDLKRQSNL